MKSMLTVAILAGAIAQGGGSAVRGPWCSHAGQAGDAGFLRGEVIQGRRAGHLSLYNSHVLANATGLGCNCSDDVLTSRRTHMSGPVGVQCRRCS